MTDRFARQFATRLAVLFLLGPLAACSTLRTDFVKQPSSVIAPVVDTQTTRQESSSHVHRCAAVSSPADPVPMTAILFCMTMLSLFPPGG